jgi:hypothetical protein
MAMDMEESNSSAKLQRTGQPKSWTLCDPILEVDTILAHNVIHNKCDRDVLHVVGECLANAVVHIDLPIGHDWLVSLQVFETYAHTSLPSESPPQMSEQKIRGNMLLLRFL